MISRWTKACLRKTALLPMIQAVSECGLLSEMQKHRLAAPLTDVVKQYTAYTLIQQKILSACSVLQPKTALLRTLL